MLTNILSIKFNKTVINAALAASGTALVVACAERARPTTPWRPRRRQSHTRILLPTELGTASTPAAKWATPSGTSNWTASSPRAPNVSGSLSLAQRIDIFSQTGSFFAGLQAGYNYMLPNRIVVGGEVDATFPTFLDRNGISTGGITNLTSPTLAPNRWRDSSRFRHHARPHRLTRRQPYYATGGFAWTYDQQLLTQVATGANESPFLWRLGYARLPLRHRSHRIGRRGSNICSLTSGSEAFRLRAAAQRFDSDLALARGLSGWALITFDPAAARPNVDFLTPRTDPARVGLGSAFHAQTSSSQSICLSISGTLSVAKTVSIQITGRETWDVTFYAGVRLWQGASSQSNPEIDQGFGLSGTLGVAGFPSGEAYKVGASVPIHPYPPNVSLRQTIDLGGETQKVKSDINQFAGSQTANRLVLWIGRFSVADDSTDRRNSTKTDFLNWAMVNTGTFDYAGDGWAIPTAARPEGTQGHFPLRGPLGPPPAAEARMAACSIQTSTNSKWSAKSRNGTSCGVSPARSRSQAFSVTAEPPCFSDAIALAQATGTPATTALVRNNVTNRTGVSLNLEQQITETMGSSPALAGPTGRSSLGISPTSTGPSPAVCRSRASNGATPDDTIGIGGIVNGIDGVHRAYFNAGGLGILIGDGQLPKSRGRSNLRDLLQLCADRFDAGVGRLSIHRQSGLQHRPRPGECLCRARSHPVLDEWHEGQPTTHIGGGL